MKCRVKAHIRKLICAVATVLCLSAYDKILEHTIACKTFSAQCVTNLAEVVEFYPYAIDKFLRVFGINSLDELPETEALSVAAAQTEEAQAAEKTEEELALEADEKNQPKADYVEAVDSAETDVIFENGVSAPTEN